MSPGRAGRHGFKYFRHGTQSLYAALDVKSWLNQVEIWFARIERDVIAP